MFIYFLYEPYMHHTMHQIKINGSISHSKRCLLYYVVNIIYQQTLSFNVRQYVVNTLHPTTRYIEW